MLGLNVSVTKRFRGRGGVRVQNSENEKVSRRMAPIGDVIDDVT